MSRCHRARDVTVCADSREIPMVVVVRNIVDVSDVRVRNVDVVQVTGTHPASAVIPAAISPPAVARIVGRTPPQREPAKINANPKAPAATESEADSKARDRQSSPLGPERNRDSSIRSVREPNPSRRSRRPSVHSGKAQIPKAHHPPRSNPRVQSTPNDRNGKAPIPVATEVGTHTEPYTGEFCHTP